MTPADVDRFWEACLEAVRSAHAEGEDRRLVEALERAAGGGGAPSIEPIGPDAGLEAVLERLRRMNFALWHIEDEARRRDVADAYVATTKRWIDPHNQARNDAIEAIDALLEPRFPQPAAAPTNTETPGTALDRLSVLALKIFHTEEEAARTDAPEAHRARMRERLGLLRAQADDLRAALRTLLDDLAAGRRRFRRYRQFKMYNDPETNPAVRRSRG